MILHPEKGLFVYLTFLLLIGVENSLILQNSLPVQTFDPTISENFTSLISTDSLRVSPCAYNNSSLFLSVVSPWYLSSQFCVDLVPRVGINVFSTTEVWVVGNYAILVDQFVKIFDVRDKARPEFIYSVPQYEDYFPEKIYVKYDYAFIGHSYGFVVLSIENIEEPYEVVHSTEILFHDQVRGIFVFGEIAYILYHSEGLYLFNITDISSPQIISKYPIIPNGYRRAIQVVDGIAYVCRHDGGFEIIDCRNHFDPQLIMLYQDEDKLKNCLDVIIDEDESIAYFACLEDGINILDVSNTSNPVFLSQFGMSNAHRIQLQHRDDGTKILYVTLLAYTDGNELYILNVTDSFSPSLFYPNENDLEVTAVSLFLDEEDEDLAYLADTGNGLKIVNVSNLTQVEIISLVDDGKFISFYIQDLTTISIPCEYYDGNCFYAVFIDGYRDIGIVKIKTNSSFDTPLVEMISKTPSGDMSLHKVFTSELYPRLVVVTTYYGFYIFNVTKDFSIEELSFTESAFFILYGVAFHPSGDDCLYLGERSYVNIWNISDARNPVLSGSLGLGEIASLVFLEEENGDVFGYSTNFANSLHIFDASDPFNPYLIDSYDDPDDHDDYETTKLFRDESTGCYYLLATYKHSYGYFDIFNVTDRTHPERIYSIDLEFPLGIAVDSGHCFVAYGSGILILKFTTDVSKPEILFQDDNIFNSRYFTYALFPVENYLFAAVRDDGIKVYHYGDILLTGSPRVDGGVTCGNVSVVIEVEVGGEMGNNYNIISQRNSKNTTSFTLMIENTCRKESSICDLKNNSCICDVGFLGMLCEDWVCKNVKMDHPLVCSGFGNCSSLENCSCVSTRYGEKCEFWECFGLSFSDSNVCGGYGSCVSDDICQCYDGYNSIELNGICNEWFCGQFPKGESSNVCNGRGECVKSHFCDCYFGYEGDLCETWSCGYDQSEIGLVCSGNGKCISPNECNCNSGYIGDRCETNSLYYSVMAPILTLFSISVLSCIFCGICFVFCLVCFVLLLFCVIFVSGLSFLVSIVLKQRKGIHRFSKLRNFDLLLKEQELDSDTNVARLKINRELFSIPFEELKLVCVLGEGGSNSTVYESIWQKKKVAFKCFKTRAVCSSQHSFDEFEKEVEVMANLSHPHIIRFFGASLHPPRVGIVMEFCENGEMIPFFRKFSKKKDDQVFYPFEEKIRMLSEITSAFVYLHSRNIIHRDLKSENVLIDSKENCKVMDFGLSKYVERISQIKTSRVGTCFYMAPELVFERNYDEKCDVFSFGILIWIIFTESSFPYGQVSNTNIEIKVASNPNFRPSVEEFDKEIFQKHFQQQEKQAEGKDRRKIKTKRRMKKYFDWLKILMTNCWREKPEERKSFEEISEILLNRSFEKEEEEKKRKNGNHSLEEELIKLKKSLEKRKNENDEIEREILRMRERLSEKFGDSLDDQELRKIQKEVEETKELLEEYDN